MYNREVTPYVTHVERFFMKWAAASPGKPRDQIKDVTNACIAANEIDKGRGNKLLL